MAMRVNLVRIVPKIVLARLPLFLQEELLLLPLQLTAGGVVMLLGVRMSRMQHIKFIAVGSVWE